jgi:hypothetical protein
VSGLGERMVCLHLFLGDIVSTVFTKIEWVAVDDDSDIVLGFPRRCTVYRWQAFNDI